MAMSAARRAATAGSLALAAGSLGGCLSPTTYGTGEAPELAIFREATGGLAGPVREKPDYKPRSPLVMPPSADLRPPEPAAASSDPAWPTDPDKTRTRATGVAAILQSRAQEGSSPLAEPAPRLRSGIRDEVRGPTLEEDIEAARKFRGGVADINGEGVRERRYLTDPPDAYREPSAAAPTTFAQEEVVPKKKKGFFGRLFGG
jgi:hypothetical protein